MENFFTRYKNPLVLMTVLFIQVVVLATQVKRTADGRTSTSGGTRLIRVWTVTTFTPFEKMFISTGHFFRNGWHNYIDLHGVREQNKELQERVANLQLEQVRLKEDAAQGRRLQALLDFKQKSIYQTVAAQVVGSSGSELSRVVYIDKGSKSGIKQDMAVITPDGVVGKVKDVFPYTAQVLMINDRESGAGIVLERTRLQGILRGNSLGELAVNDITADEKVEAGEPVVTSGGDRIFPKGLPVGTISTVTPDHDNDPFLIIKIKPAAELSKLEEVLVVTKTVEDASQSAGSVVPLRAADILAQRLPSVPKKEETPLPGASASPKSSQKTKAGGTPVTANKTTTLASGNVASNPKKESVAEGTAKKTSGVGNAQSTLPNAVQNSSAPKAAGAGTQGGQPQALGAGTPATPRPKPAAPKKKPAAIDGGPSVAPQPTPTATPSEPPTPGAETGKPPR